MKLGHQHYPTPSQVAAKMIEAAGGVQGKVVLDPSCGMGELIKSINYRHPKLVMGIEIDESLYSICEGKKYRMIGRDFLQFAGRPDISVILMNPPFDDAADHITHAWTVLFEGTIVALCNIETLTNPFSQQRKHLLRLIEQHGRWESLGKCFSRESGAMRVADVEVAMIVLTKVQESVFDFDGFTRRSNSDYAFEDSSGSALNFRDPVKSRVNAYNAGIAALGTAYKTLRQAATILSPILGEDDALRTILASFGDKYGSGGITEAVDEITKRAWKDVFNKTKIGNLISSDQEAKFQADMVTMQQVSFSEENVLRLGAMLYANAAKATDTCILRAFDVLTKYHKENLESPKGWKTNAPNRVRKKVIMPWGGSYGSLLNHYRYDDARDVEKAMSLISGIAYDAEFATDPDTGIKRKVIHIMNLGGREHIPGKPHEYDTEFFHVRHYPNAGTLHLTFKSDDIWAKFNIAALKLKGYYMTLDNDTNHTGRHWKRSKK